MKKFYIILSFLFFSIGSLIAQESPAGTFVGPTAQVVCGNIETHSAFYYITIEAKDYSNAREVAQTTIDRFTNFYEENPESLSEFFNCRPLGCPAPASCDSEGSLIKMQGLSLIPLTQNLYLLYMRIDYKVQCFACDG